MDVGSVWVPAAAALGAFALSIVGQYATADIARRQQKQDRKEDFQHKTLLELQEAVYHHARSFSLAKHEYLEAKQGAGVPASTADMPSMILNREYAPRVAVLMERVFDSELRRLVSDYIALSNELFEGDKPDEESFAIIDELRSSRKNIDARIGVVLRSL